MIESYPDEPICSFVCTQPLKCKDPSKPCPWCQQLMSDSLEKLPAATVQ